MTKYGYESAHLYFEGSIITLDAVDLWPEHFLASRYRIKTAFGHLDDNKQNNHLSNLAYGTNQENANDAIRNGRTARGERCAASKITAEIVLAIRQETILSNQQIAAKYGLSASHVTSIRRGKSWRHVGGPIVKGSGPQIGRPSKLSVEQVREIKQRSEARVVDLAREFSVSNGAIIAIRSGITWTWVGSGRP